jgi:hypothetical protein
MIDLLSLDENTPSDGAPGGSSKRKESNADRPCKCLFFLDNAIQYASFLDGTITSKRMVSLYVFTHGNIFTDDGFDN